MEYRLLGDSSIKVSAVSLGTEYLLNLPQEHVVAVVHEALDRGINYLDLFYAQPGFRDIMRKALHGRRDGAMLAAHLGAAEANGQYERTRDPERAESYFLDFLRRYDTDYVDVLFLHNVDEQEDYNLVMEGEFREMAERYHKEGKVRLIGFSGHTISTSLQAVESGAVDVLMFPINIAGHAIPGRKALLQTCADLGVGLVAMKPYAGGKLLGREAKLDVDGYLTGGDSRSLERKSAITPVQCLAYVLAQPGLSAIVPGCKDQEQLRQALAVLDASPEEKDFSHILTDFAHYESGECVYCNHCLPCPSHIDIGQTIRLLDAAQGKPPTPELAAAYEMLPAPASDCIACGSCVERCPFDANPMDKIEAAAALYEA